MESIPQIGGTTQQIILYGNITIITVLFLCNFLLTDCEQKLSLITANTLITNTYVWNLITCSFYETNIVKIAIDITILYVITKNITITNWEQFSIFFGFTLLACSLITSTYYFFRFLFTSMEDFLILPTYGFDGVLMLLMVYARQQFKGQVIHPVAATITYNNLPIVFLAYLFIITILGLRILCMDVMFGLISLLFSWSYLRFYYRYNEGDAPGDSAEDFTFVGMFPETLHTVLIPFTTAFYNVFALLGLFPPLEFVERKTVQHHLRYEATKEQEEEPLIVKQDLVAERRRAKAMRLLDAKIAELSKEPEGWGDEEAGLEIVEEDFAHTPTTPVELLKLKI